MADPRVERLASVLVNYSTSIQPGDLVAIQGMPDASPLLLAVYEEVLKAGGHPHLFLGLPGSEEAFFRLASEEQLTFASPVHKMVMETFDARIAIRSDNNTRELSAVDPSKQSLRSKALTPLMKTAMERGATGELKWCGTQYHEWEGLLEFCLICPEGGAESADCGFSDSILIHANAGS